MLSEKYVRTGRKNTVYVGFIGVPEKSKRGIIAKGSRRKLNTVHNLNVVGCSYIAASSKAACPTVL
jgi:hypothetical protein